MHPSPANPGGLDPQVTRRPGRRGGWRAFGLSLAWALAVACAGCATVPNEAILLSEAIGDDLNAVHASYAALVRTHFASLRQQVNAFIDTRWTPTYLREFIASGDLVALATAKDPTVVLDGVGAWAGVAVEEIEGKRHELLDPLDRDEQSLLASVDDAFARLSQANATVTAHLRSLRHVKEAEDQALQALRLKDLRDSVTVKLAETSERTAKALQELEKATGDVRGATERKQELLEKAKGGGHDR